MKGRSVIAERLREARIRAGLSQKRLGILAGIDEFSASARINQYERGKHSPEFTTVERLAKVLGAPTPFFYCRDDDLAKWILRHSEGANPKIGASQSKSMGKRKSASLT